MVKLNLDYYFENKKWYKFIDKKTISEKIQNLLHQILFTLSINNDLNIELSITFTDDNNIRKINKQFRGKDSPTNVLSFPFYEKEFFEIIKHEKYVVLGDIMLSLETLLKEVKEENITFEYHFDHLVIHSILHLLGYDHIKDDEAEEMENIENKVLALNYRN